MTEDTHKRTVMSAATDQRPPSSADSFYASVTLFDDFDKVADPALYSPLPAGWVVGPPKSPASNV